MARYPDPARFLVDYNPDLQAKLIHLQVSLSVIALNDKIPSLGLLRSTFGETTPTEWLKVQFGSLNDYAEQGVGISQMQICELCSLVLAEYWFLNAAEICMFIARFKLGKYGQFYGAVGPMKIMSALLEYSKERKISIEQFEREQDRKRAEQLINSREQDRISHQEYVELKKRAENGDEAAKLKLKKP